MIILQRFVIKIIELVARVHRCVRSQSLFQAFYPAGGDADNSIPFFKEQGGFNRVAHLMPMRKAQLAISLEF